jgi:hypothetical protein
VNDREAREQLAQLRAQMDQAREATGELASLLFRYYSELLDQGFSAEQALTLAVSYQASLVSGRSES